MNDSGDPLNDALSAPPVVPGHRGLVPGLNTPFPLIQAVPPMLAEDAFVQRMLPAYDEVLAPVISTLDCFDAYLDPYLAPIDMVRYMGSWMLTWLEAEQNEDALRFTVATAEARSGWRGTVKAMQDRLVPFDASTLDIQENGGVTVSDESTDVSSWPEPGPFAATVTVTPVDTHPAAIERLKKLIWFMMPAHIQLTIVVNT